MSEKLPPGTKCVICEDVATGRHYSVISCNGCKTFFRRAVVNNRTFACRGVGNCPVNKGVRCACRHCRLQKCLLVGMNRNAIQNDRDRIGYTRRPRTLNGSPERERSRPPKRHLTPSSAGEESSTKSNGAAYSDPLLNRLTTLENTFSLLWSRGDIEPYESIEAALAGPSRFMQEITTKWTDPPAVPRNRNMVKMSFWRSRSVALFADWAKTFACFRQLPHSDKVALITNHASSYIVMCEAFRTPPHVTDRIMHPDGHCFTRNPPPESLFYTNLSGLNPVIAMMIDEIMKPFRQLEITTTEFAALQTIMLFDPDTIGLDSASQRNVSAERSKYLQALFRHISHSHDPVAAVERYSLILLRIPVIRKVAAKQRESLQIIDMFELYNLHNLVKEIGVGVPMTRVISSVANNIRI